MPRSRRCCSPRRCTTTSCAPSSAPRSGSSSSAATPARCTTWRCCRLRRRRDQPVPRVRVDRGPDRPRHARPRRHRPAEGGQELHQGVRQGRAQGDVEDGRVDGGVLHRRPDLRGDRPRRRARRALLHRHRQPPRWHRPRRDRQGGRDAPRGGQPDAGPRSAPTASSSSAASTSGVARASTTCSTPRRCSSCSTPRGPSATTSSRSTPAASTTSRSTWPRCAGCSSSPTERAADPDRRGRVGRRHRQALLDRRDVLRLDLGRGARDAGDRHEQHRRQVEHR